MPSEKIGALRRLAGRLSSPDMVVTHSSWDVYLPVGLPYGEPSTNMELGAAATAVTAEAMKSASRPLGRTARCRRCASRCPPPACAYSFSKIYANCSREAGEFSVPYSSRGGAWFARVLAVLGTSVFWLGVWVLLQRPLRRRPALAGVVGGAALVLAAIGWLGVSTAWPVIWSIFLAGVYGLHWLIANHARTAAI